MSTCVTCMFPGFQCRLGAKVVVLLTLAVSRHPAMRTNASLMVAILASMAVGRFWQAFIQGFIIFTQKSQESLQQRTAAADLGLNFGVLGCTFEATISLQVSMFVQSTFFFAAFKDADD